MGERGEQGKVIFDRVFEWDDEKNKANREKHKISFESAAYVFFDPNYIEIPDEAHSNDETRYDVIGFVNKVLFVVCTNRGEATRIISARKATAKERSRYYGNRS